MVMYKASIRGFLQYKLALLWCSFLFFETSLLATDVVNTDRLLVASSQPIAKRASLAMSPIS